MAALKEMAADAINTVTPAMLMTYVNRIERYYSTVMRREDFTKILYARFNEMETNNNMKFANTYMEIFYTGYLMQFKF